MEPVLDETSLVPCNVWEPGRRITLLSEVLATLDELGAPRALRCVRDAADRDIRDGRGLRSWCFDRANIDAGRLLASRLSRHPFIDGSDGLFARAEGNHVMETRVGTQLVLGLGLAAVEGGIATALGGANRAAGRSFDVNLCDCDGEQIGASSVPVFVYVKREEVRTDREVIIASIERSITNGQALVGRVNEVFPRVRLGLDAIHSVAALSGAEPLFRQLIRHLRALNDAACAWPENSAFELRGVIYSPESKQTLEHFRYGPMRDFPVPDGFVFDRWSLHTKLTGGAGARLYFRPVRAEGSAVVLIGYFGPHLPCVRYPT